MQKVEIIAPGIYGGKACDAGAIVSLPSSHARALTKQRLVRVVNQPPKPKTKAQPQAQPQAQPKAQPK
jgi:hypothetical protein